MFLRARQSNHSAQAVPILLALGLAFAAQSMFTNEPFRLPVPQAWSTALRQNVGIGLLLAAIACSVWAASRLWPTTWDNKNARPISSEAEASLRTDWRITWRGPALAGVCYLVSLGLYVVAGETLGVQLLWLAGMAILLISQRPITALKADPERIEWWEWWLVTAIAAIGFGLRYWRLTEIPSHVDNDVALMGSYSLDIIRTSNTHWFGMAASEHTLFSHQLMAWSMRLFGQDHYGLVMISVIAGTLTLPVVFLLGRELFGRRAGFIAMSLLTVSYTHIHFSRILFTPLPTLFITLLFYFLFRGLRTRHGFWFALSGIPLGLAMLVYYSGRIALVVVAAVWVWVWLWKRRETLAHLKNWGLLALGALLSFGPMLGFVFLKFPEFVGRGSVVTLFNPVVYSHSLDKYQVQTVGALLLEQFKRSFLTFHLYGDESPHFAYMGPMVSPLTAALLVVGLGFCLFRLKDVRRFTPVAWIVSTLLLGGVLTSDPPYWPHLAITLPAVALIAALAMDHILSLLPSWGQWGRGLSIALLVVMLIFLGVRNWISYTTQVRDNALPRIRIARYINSLPNGYQVRLVSDDWRWDAFAFQFFNQGVPGMDVTAAQLQSAPPLLDGPTVFILFNHPELVPILQRQYLGGEVKEHLDMNKQVAFISYRLIPEGYAVPVMEASSEADRLPGWGVLSGVLVVWGGVLVRLWKRRAP